MGSKLETESWTKMRSEFQGASGQLFGLFLTSLTSHLGTEVKTFLTTELSSGGVAAAISYFPVISFGFGLKGFTLVKDWVIFYVFVFLFFLRIEYMSSEFFLIPSDLGDSRHWGRRGRWKYSKVIYPCPCSPHTCSHSSSLPAVHICELCCRPYYYKVGENHYMVHTYMYFGYMYGCQSSSDQFLKWLIFGSLVRVGNIICE